MPIYIFLNESIRLFSFQELNVLKKMPPQHILICLHRNHITASQNRLAEQNVVSKNF